MKLRRPSPALVISCIALGVALSGTAVAATIITNSSQIRKGVITGAHIKNKTIKNVDIADKTITASKLKSAPAAGGPTTAYQVLRRAGPEGQPANVNVKVASLTVPPGTYVVSASTVMASLIESQNPLLPDRDSPQGICRLDLAGDETTSLQNIVVNRKQAPATLFMQRTRTVGASAEFFLECGAGTSFRLSETSIIAQKVSDAVETNTP